MAEKKSVREKFIELMYVLLYVMLMMKETEEVGVENYDEKLQRIEDIKRNITIYCTNIASVLDTAVERSKSFENNENFKKKFDDVIRVHDIWKSYHEKSEEFAKKAIEDGGGYDENNKIKVPQDLVSVDNFVKENKIEELKKYITDISNEVKDISEDDETMLKILEELKYFGVNKIVNRDPNSNEDVEVPLFKDKKLVDLLYYLYNEELNISSYMRIIFDKLMKGIELTHPNFENFELIVIPKKDVIVAGKNYEATVFLNVKDYVKIENEEPVITVNGNPINVTNGVGIISIPTKKNLEFDEEGKCTISYRVKYTQRNPYSDKNIEVEKDFAFNVINKNEIEGQIDVSKVFYKSCSNKYIIKNLDPDPNVNITYNIEGGNIEKTDVKSQTETELTIFPTSDKCKLLVIKDGEVSNTFEFVTMDIPDPSYDFYVGDSVLYPDKINEMRDSDLDDISIDVLCNELFSKSYPLDSVFAVKNWVIEFTDAKGNQLGSKSVKDSNTAIFDDNEKDIIKLNNCKFITVKVSNIIRYHKKDENSKPEEIELFKPGEFLTRKIEVIHKKNTKKGKGKNR